MWHVKAWFKHSLTILWARLLVLGAFSLESAHSLSGDPAVDAAIRAILRPEYIPFYVIAIGIITELCRRRTAQSPERPQ